jgi:hypothetical protein
MRMPPFVTKWLPLVFALVMLAPYLMTGFYQDDVLNSVFPSYLALHQRTFADLLAEQAKGWMFEHGRLFPLSHTVFAWWYLCQDLTVYRIVQVGLVLLSLWTWVRLLIALGASRRLAVACAMCALLAFQLREYHDPISSYAFMMQLSFLMGSGSILLLLRFQRARDSRALWGSLALWACALLYYETGLAFFPMLALLAWRARARLRSFLARYGHTLLLALYLGAVALLRLGATVRYEGVQGSFGIQAVKTFFYQLSGTLPLSYAIFGRSGFYSGATLASAEFWSPWFFVTAGLAAATAYSLLSKPQTPLADLPATQRGRFDLFFLGITLLCVPTALVALSVKYQSQIHRPGLAYLPVFISCFGLSVFLGAWLSSVRRRVGVACAVFALVAAFAFSANLIAVRRLNAEAKDPRVLVERALRAKILAPVPPGSPIFVTDARPYAWLSREFVHLHAGQAFELAGASALGAGPRREAYLLEIDLDRKEVILSSGYSDEPAERFTRVATWSEDAL